MSATQQLDAIRRQRQSLTAEEYALAAAAEQRRIALVRKREQLISRRCSLLTPRQPHDPHEDPRVQAANDRLNAALRAGEEFATTVTLTPASVRNTAWCERTDRKWYELKQAVREANAEYKDECNRHWREASASHAAEDAAKEAELAEVEAEIREVDRQLEYH